ncbi:hypothetical protein Mapa_015390 [Marchantia paleacea]|nr:hypothetical protein Mapa_015390 [Marchantia paleacea]
MALPTLAPSTTSTVTVTCGCEIFPRVGYPVCWHVLSSRMQGEKERCKAVNAWTS